MLKLIFKLGKFRYNLLPLFTLRLFYDICNRSMSIINGTSLFGQREFISQDIRLTRMMGHLSLALMYANDVLSEVNAGPILH